MFESLFMLILLCNHAESPYAPVGRIHGVVVNGTRGNEPMGDVDVVLRAGRDGVLAPMTETRTDVYGKFVFDNLPLDDSTIYLPGADRDGVHYPSERVQLDRGNRFAHVRIVAFEVVEAPSPLVAGQHDIDINVRLGVMEVSETLVVGNTSGSTYVGEAVDDKRPVTLRLSIPPNFDRVTFGNEFYGRRFRIVDHQPVTDIPWPPGIRELKISYRISMDTTRGLFRRTLDLPCSKATLRVRGENTDKISCNLAQARGDGEAIVFTSAAEQLAAGDVIELQIGTPPFPWMKLSRWGSVIALGGLALVTAAVLRRREGLTGPL
jgi:hypothetical protein